MQRISEIAKSYLKEESVKDSIECDSLFYGTFSHLDEIYYRAFEDGDCVRPLLRHRKILNALDRESKKADAIFIKKYIRIAGRLARLFKLKSL